MTAPFDWAGLWLETTNLYFSGKGPMIARSNAAVAHLQTRIEAAFVSVEEYRQLEQMHDGLQDAAQGLISREGQKRKFMLGHRVTKIKGSKWTGRIVGFYSTDLTPIGYAIESENEPGSVQIYPESAIAAILGDKP